jgi:hypothetical protein
MASGPEIDVLARVVILRHAQRRLHKLPRRTPEFARQLTAVMQIEAELDAALERLGPYDHCSTTEEPT